MSVLSTTQILFHNKSQSHFTIFEALENVIQFDFECTERLCRLCSRHGPPSVEHMGEDPNLLRAKKMGTNPQSFEITMQNYFAKTMSLLKTVAVNHTIFTS